MFKVEVDLVEALGSDLLVHFAVHAGGAHIDEDGTTPSSSLRASFVAQLTGRSKIRDGVRVDLALDPRDLHFLDAKTVSAIY